MNKQRKPGEGIRIRFLGTGAADWPFAEYPGEAGRLLSGDFRGSASILINERILVDCGPTVPAAMETFGVDRSGLTDILVTHTHADHFSVESLERLAEGMAPRRINLWMEQGALGRAGTLGRLYGLRRMAAGAGFEAGGLAILPLPANHGVSESQEQPLLFLFSGGGKRLLYALDGAWLMKAAWRAIMDLQLDAVIWDATIGVQPGDYRVFEHNSIPMIRLMNQTLENNRVIGASSRIVLSHLARTLHPGHRELGDSLRGEGLEPAHDGMVLEL